MLKEGSIIEAPFWHEPVEVKKVEERSIGIRIIGSTVYSHSHVDDIIPHDELSKIRHQDSSFTFTANAEEVFLAVECLRFYYASLFDPFLAMNISKIDPLPFQIDAVYGYVLKLPKIRFMIADDPGAGKTIMAGLIIKELKLRGIVNRILIVVPGHLKDQWRRELKERFQEPFTVVTRQIMDAHYGENVWERDNQIITSIDFAKRDEILQTLTSVHWDLVVVDEAHKMAAYRYAGTVSKTDRYRLGKVLSKNTKHFLFLTATPHKGDPENYRLLLDLLLPGFFATTQMVQESIEKSENPLFIRRLKEDLKDFEGKPIFTNRYAKTVKFRLSDREKLLYNKLSEYVISQYNKVAQKNQKRNVAFALLILQRRLASSIYALHCSLLRRKQKLEELLREPEAKPELAFINMEKYEDYEDYEESERWQEENKWETLSIAANREELKREIKTLEELINLSAELIKDEEEVKLKELKKAIEEGFRKIEELKGNKKILIFTESRDTMDYLYGKIKSWGYSVNFIHGGMSLDQRIEAEKIFKNQTEVMVATEAAGEGINLQFCHIMINYDIPWNPNRLEQRMGRIHRYGQQKDVFMFNLVAEDTREGEVFSKLFDKLEEIRNALGTDKVFDIVGDVFYGKNLYQLIIDAITQAKTIDEIISEIDIKIDEDYIKKIKTVLGESLATRNIDYTRIKEMAEKAKELRLIPEYVEEYFKKAFEKAGGRYKVRRDGFLSIESIPYELKQIASDVNFKNRFGLMLSSYPKITFDKDMAFKNPELEFVSFGHPLFEALLEWVKKEYLSILRKGAVFEDPEGRLKGFLYFYEGEIKDGKGDIAAKKLIALYEDGDQIRELNPSIIWDLVPAKSKTPIELISIAREKLEDVAFEKLRLYMEEILKERQRQAEIKKKYGVSSLQHLINELDFELIQLLERQDRGEKVEVVIRNKEESKKHYENVLKELRRTIEQEVSLVISMPKLIGAIYVKPVTSEMVSDEEIEKVGMQIAMQYEISQGRKPEDVSKENLGFDIRSKGKDEVRYIEVKARAEEGEIALTPNEWFKAKRFKDQYYLYVVANALTNPTLYIIRNPAETLKIQEKVEIVRFLVPDEEWKRKKIEEWRR
ncbi:helicase-related protein [Thermodesulfovibrio sp. 3907-1M]|uniref:Helicase-related protein n=1 Tax=Thermodesulfovibrio autotrophicus TaxID=3118333 RepID=A0AAU8H0K3_9BACT